jgi:hexosaminidase
MTALIVELLAIRHETVQSGIARLIESGEYLIRADDAASGLRLTFRQQTELGFKIEPTSAGTATISFAEPADAFRAVARLLGALQAGEAAAPYSEQTPFSFRCVQIDASRNGVPTVETLKAMIRRFALMGLNAACLYTEDTYAVDDEPFFGYLRGRYEKTELIELDDYAVEFGIEMFPCIQTLGHMEQVLKWTQSYRNVTDTPSILLVGQAETYRLLRKMIGCISSCFRSKRIHIGMDEAHGLGLGRYRKIHGDRSSFQIMNEHLTKVSAICRELKLRPMIWSDMYFRLGSATHDYYDPDSRIPQAIIDDIPADVELVYWDYYHKDKAFYDTFIAKHRDMRKEPIVAPAAWNWTRFWTALPYAYDTIRPCLASCRDNGVEQVFLTSWCDDGMEVDPFSVLPAVQFFAELCYRDAVERKAFASNLLGSCGIELDAYEAACELDSCARLKPDVSTMSDISKWLLWDDPLIGLCEPHRQGRSFRQHYAALAEKLSACANRPSAQNRRLRLPAQLARVLSIKCDLREKLIVAYRNKDRETIRQLLEREAVPLLAETRVLWKMHRDMWLDCCKPFGLEVLERRYGCLIARIESMIDRLQSHVHGKIDAIPEFETTLLTFEKDTIVNPEDANTLPYIGPYPRIASPSSIH